MKCHRAVRSLTIGELVWIDDAPHVVIETWGDTMVEVARAKVGHGSTRDPDAKPFKVERSLVKTQEEVVASTRDRARTEAGDVDHGRDLYSVFYKGKRHDVWERKGPHRSLLSIIPHGAGKDVAPIEVKRSEVMSDGELMEWLAMRAYEHGHVPYAKDPGIGYIDRTLTARELAMVPPIPQEKIVEALKLAVQERLGKSSVYGISTSTERVLDVDMIRAENKHLNENLTAVQVRCTELLEEKRELERKVRGLHDTINAISMLSPHPR